MLEVVNRAKQNCPVDMGQLRSSIRGKFTGGRNSLGQFQEAGLVAEVGSDLEYAAFIEFGTGPRGRATYGGTLPAGYVHGPGHFMPPIEPIKDWCKRHGIPENLAFIVAKKIGELGLPANPFLWPAFESVKDQFRSEVEDAVNAVGLKLRR
jgi:HK97 gp10 family phage protein